MKGFIIIFEEGLQTIDMVKRLNAYIGRVSTIQRGGKQHHYYYPGILHNIQFYKLGKGIYFIKEEEIPILDNVNIIKADLEIKNELMGTGREYFLKKFKGKKVNNLE